MMRAVPLNEQIVGGSRLLRDLSSALISARRNTATHSAHPPTQGLVLDVGGGQSPHHRADLVVDKYVADDFERGHAMSFSKPLVIGDGQALPLADKAFVYVIASHVLEHATDPIVFASELTRVAPAGFVQVPSREAELTFGWPFHPWLIDREEATLVFKPRGVSEAPVGTLFHSAYQDSRLFNLWFNAERSKWHHSIEWRETLVVQCEGSSHARQTATFDLDETLHALDALAHKGRLRGPEGLVAATLRCPVDHGELRATAEGTECQRCDRNYPVVASVPLLLADAAR